MRGNILQAQVMVANVKIHLLFRLLYHMTFSECLKVKGLLFNMRIRHW